MNVPSTALRSQRALLALLSALIVISLAVAMGFAVLSNDFFALVFQAEQLCSCDLQTFQNGFFPPGYPLVLSLFRGAGRAWMIRAALGVNAIATGCIVFSSLRILRPGSAAWIHTMVALSLVFFPPLLYASLTPTPDHLVTALLCIGVSVVLSSQRNWRYLWVGLAIGLATLLRHHALVLALLFIVVAFQERQWGKYLLGLAGPIAILVSLQIASSGDLLWNTQNMNVWRSMYGIDWSNPPSNLPSSLEIIAKDPVHFVEGLLLTLIQPWSAIPCILLGVAVVLTRRTIVRQLAILLAAYMLIVAAGGSQRGLVLVFPIGLTLVVQALSEKRSGGLERLSLPRASRAGMALAGITTMVLLAISVSHAWEAKVRMHRYNELATYLNATDRTTASKVFSDDHNLYFARADYARPRIQGGWEGVGMPLFAWHFRSMNDSSASTLSEALKESMIERVAIRVPPVSHRLDSLLRSSPQYFLRDTVFANLATVYRVL